MRICGIELKSNQAILSVIDKEDDIVTYIDMKIKKIALEDDESQNAIRAFCNDLLEFLINNQINQVVIKKRAKKGNFAGGAVTFKMEALIQLNPHCEVRLIAPQAISAYEKKNSIELPNELKKYQEQAYLSALAA
jgi:hypothetical protein